MKYALYTLMAMMPLGACTHTTTENPERGGVVTTRSDGTVTQLNDSTFDAATRTGLVLVKFWGPWCGPCRELDPIYEAAAARHRDINFTAVNIDKSKAVPKRFSVQTVPTIVALYNGQVIWKSGGLSAQELEDRIQNTGAQKSDTTIIGTVVSHDVEEPVAGSKYFDTPGHRFVIDADGVRYWIRLTEEEYTKKFPYLKPDAKIIINYRDKIDTPAEWVKEVGLQLDVSELGGPAGDKTAESPFQKFYIPYLWEFGK